MARQRPPAIFSPISPIFSPIFRSVPGFIFRRSGSIFSPMCGYFQSLYIVDSGFSSILYIQRVTWNPIFSAYSADLMYICVYMRILFLVQYPLFLDDLPHPVLFLDEFMAIFSPKQPFIFRLILVLFLVQAYFQPRQCGFSSDHQLYRVNYFWFLVGYVRALSYYKEVHKANMILTGIVVGVALALFLHYLDINNKIQ